LDNGPQRYPNKGLSEEAQNGNPGCPRCAELEDLNHFIENVLNLL